ncbi:MAG: transporter substrate-binding domain-containing protein, partial [Desulfobacterium sp.]|nr:transporter substrate-binding domain-containing protein [Desulfobacterium sp.]
MLMPNFKKEYRGVMMFLISFFKKKTESIAIKSLSFTTVFLYFFILLNSQSVVFAQNSPSSPQTIIIGGDFDYPPYEFLDDQGFPTGYAVELTQAIADVMGAKVEIRLGSWDHMRIALEKGEIDALQGMVFTDDRKKKYDFTPPHAIIHQSIFYRKGSSKAQGIEALKEKDVIVQKGGSIHDTFLKMGMDDKLVLTDTHASALRLLASGKHDYAVVANLPGLYLGKKLHLSNLVMSGKPIKSFRYCYAVKKGNIELLALLNEGLAILKGCGSFATCLTTVFSSHTYSSFFFI